MTDLEVGKIGEKEATVLFQHLLVFRFSLCSCFGHFLSSFFIFLILFFISIFMVIFPNIILFFY